MPYYHSLSDVELIAYVDSNPGTDLERELADRLDEAHLEIQELREGLEKAQESDEDE